MKKSWLIAILLLGATVFGFASEELDIYTRLYKDSSTPAERLGLLKSVAESNLEGAGSLYAEALAQLLREQPTLRSSAERETADSLARLLSKLLGEAKYTAAAEDLWRLVQNFSNPLVKSDALIAIGRTRSDDLLEEVSRTLSDLNLKPTPDPEAGEKVAYGAILALEKYRKPEGYLPVFFASTGWYGRRVRDQASASLPLILEDPSEPLASIIQSSGYVYSTKLLALQTAENSNAPSAGKAAVALAGLSEGWRSASNDVKDRLQLASMRKLAINMFIRYRSDDPAVIPLLERSYKDGIDMEEKLGAVTALSVNGSDEAARSLSSFLVALNGKRKDNVINQEDERMVRALIPALGATGKAIARPALRTVDILDWTNAVKVLAIEALKKLP
ncbi:hypothetical protein MASR2M78_07350 [Treponema sp.]